jgi:hypothetical protein
MKLSKCEFEALQSEWYEKLRQQGFIDIEQKDPRSVPSHIAAMETPRKLLLFETTEEYFRKISDAAFDPKTKFKSKKDKYVMGLYARGVKQIDIMLLLKQRGTPLRKEAIRFIIRKYEMAWNIRHYTKKQLGLKEKRE